MTEKVALKTVVKVRNGYAFAASDFQRVGIPVIRMSDLKEQVVNPESSARVPLDFWENYSNYRIERGDLIVGMSGSIGKIAVYQSDKPALQNQRVGVFKIVDSSRLDQNYLKYFALTLEEKLLSLGKGVAVKNISSKEIEEIKIPLPAIEEQRRIAGILARADRLRQMRRYALQLSDGYLQAVFLRMFGDPVTNPMGWEIGKLKQLCKKIVDCPHTTPVYETTNTPYACVRSSDIQRGFLDWSTTKYVSIEEYQKRIKRLEPQVGDVVYCREGARFGNAARIPDGRKICLGQRTMLFRANEKIAAPEFIWAYLESDSIYHHAARLSGGSASPHINVGDIKLFPIAIPPLKLQQEFSCIVHRFEQFRTQQREALRQADHLFDSLLHRAFRGAL